MNLSGITVAFVDPTFFEVFEHLNHEREIQANQGEKGSVP